MANNGAMVHGKRKAELESESAPAPGAAAPAKAARRIIATPARAVLGLFSGSGAKRSSRLPEHVLKVIAPANEAHQAKLLSCAQDAERHRHRIYGGAELTETANLLQSICQTTPYTLEMLRCALDQDLRRASARQLAPTTSDPEEHFVEPPMLRVGDYLYSNQMLILVTSDVTDVCKAAVRLQLLEPGKERCASSGTIAFEELSRSSQSRRLVLTLGARIHHGKLTGDVCRIKMVDTEDCELQLQLVRSRIGSIRVSALQEIEAKLDGAWSCFEHMLQQVQGHPELQVGRPQFQSWQKDLQKLDHRRKQLKPEEVIMFVGGSGAGKSRLINVLIGDAAVLPSAGEGSAVTAATVELRYCALQSEDFCAEKYHVEFVLYSRAEFCEQKQLMQEDLLEYWRLIAQRRQEMMQKRMEERRQAAQRARAAQEDEDEGEGEEEEFEEEDPEIDIRIPGTKPPRDEDAQAARRAHDWFEAVFGTDAMTGWPSKEDFCQAFNGMPAKMAHPHQHSCRMQGDLLALLKRWLTHDKALIPTGQYWPLINKAKVSGPWTVLSPNIVFVDLPGTGDANAVRNAIALREFKRADFVCVCARADRAVTDKASLWWLDKASRDLPLEQVAYTVTKCDDISAEEIRRDHGMQHCSCSKAAEKRSQNIKNALANRKVAVFTVSSRDYARCIGLEDGFPSAFRNDEATQIPKLRRHIVDLAKTRQIKAKRDLLDTLDWQIRTMSAQTVELSKLQYNGAEVYEIFEEVLKAFSHDLEGQGKKIQEDLGSKGAKLKKAAAKGIQESECRLGSKAHRYGEGWCGHWATHKALIVRDGQWGCTDIPQELSQPVIEGIDEHWNLFDVMPKKAATFRQGSQKRARRFVEDFAARVGQWPELCDHVRQLGALAVQGIGHRLGESGTSLEEYLLEKRAGYAEDVQEKVKAQLAVTLHDAKTSYSGTGSVILRKRSVTRNMPRTDLRRSAESPQERVEEAMEKFQLLIQEMKNKSCEVLRRSFAECWRDAEERSAAAQQQRKALHLALQQDAQAFEKTIKPGLEAVQILKDEGQGDVVAVDA